MGVQTILGLAHFTFQGFQTGRQLSHFQLLGGGQAQLVGAARFDQIIGGTGLDRVHCRVYRGVRGDDDHTHPRRLDAHLRQNIETIVFPQAQIEETQVEDLTLQ
ncbi:hypothetical protein D3C86_1758870 [compost metagenome]